MKNKITYDRLGNANGSKPSVTHHTYFLEEKYNKYITNCFVVYAFQKDFP